MLAKNKTIVLTGAGNGMGRELCLQLLEKGARVAAVDLKAEALEETRKLAGSKASGMSMHVLNISDRSAVEALPAEVLKIHSTIDGLFNNAGIIQPFVKVKDLDYAAIDRVLQVNFFGMLYMTKTFLPHLLSRPEAHIVNTSSMGGFLPVPGQTLYGASKAAVKLFTEGLRSELLESNVRVTVIFPGAIGTNIAQNSGVAGSLNLEKQQKNNSYKTLPAAEAARQIILGMENNAYRVLVGSDAKFMDKLYRLSPQFAAEFIYKKMKALLTGS